MPLSYDQYKDLCINDVIRFDIIPIRLTSINIALSQLSGGQHTITKVSVYKGLYSYGFKDILPRNFHMLGVLDYMTLVRKKKSLNEIAVAWWSDMTPQQRYVQMKFYTDLLKKNSLVNTKVKKIVFMYLGGINAGGHYDPII